MGDQVALAEVAGGVLTSSGCCQLVVVAVWVGVVVAIRTVGAPARRSGRRRAAGGCRYQRLLPMRSGVCETPPVARFPERGSLPSRIRRCAVATLGLFSLLFSPAVVLLWHLAALDTVQAGGAPHRWGRDGNTCVRVVPSPGGSTLLDHWGNGAAVPFSPMDGTKFRTGELFFGKHVGMWVLSR